MLSRKAEEVWPRLNGIICVYKPLEASCDYIKNKLRTRLCEDLNNMETRPPEKYVEIDRNYNSVAVKVRNSYADSTLCLGPRFQPKNVDISFASYLSKYMSGVFIVGINRGEKIVKALKMCKFTKCYHVKGLLGQASENFATPGRIIAKAKYEHVDKFLIDKILATYQAANQRRAFMENGLNIRSQEAYEFAISGLFRPKERGSTIIYSLKTVEVNPPDFTIEIQCLHENETFIKNLIHNLGVSLKCFATCSSIRCIRYGCFNVEHALLVKHWNVENILSNMELCFGTLEKHFPKVMKYTSVVTTQNLSSAQSEQ